jgi:ABC-type uncharacterized transport system involved in gliding motility auxiliary subunit
VNPQGAKPRKWVLGAGSVAAVALVFGILVFVGLLSRQFHLRWDLTREQSQSLSAVTKSLLDQVAKPLTMTVFFPPGQGDRQKAKDLLQLYALASKNISFAVVDPDREPDKARSAGFRFAGNVLLEYDGRRQMADRADEEALSEALRKVLKTERKKVYFLAGHGERSLEDGRTQGYQTARKALANEGFEVAPLNLMEKGEVPADASVLVVAAPLKPLFPQEVTALKGYLARGGRLLVMLEPYHDAGLKDFLAAYGIELNDGLILDQNKLSQSLGASAVMPMAATYGQHRITRDFTNVVTLYPLARPLMIKKDLKGPAPLVLATTTPTSWEKLGQDWQKAGKVAFDPATDKKGPFNLALLVDIKADKPEKPEGKEAPKSDAAPNAILAVFGDVDFAANGYFNLSMNGDLFLNTINFLAAEDKQITIRKDDAKPQPLILSKLAAWTLFLTTLVLMPLVMLAAGLRAYLRRRASK